ncbi:hypothetical protein BC962_2617 [Gillisia mitskevichiae]|uniref:Uncharacterized protein n=1 Tax=Gillisia mitskevichiae TaxID=270921 RepID=A0A495P4M5_9FLAO|nr:hypothetical protein [Gillisia mitskevichiae]RKS44945.1 hypothetical protein BC962_2617 [Gillisia mitskevichiae]
MRNTYLIFTLLVGLCFTGVGQDLNTYKYVSVPERFDFLKEANQYQVNELTKFLFEKYGFKAFMANELNPDDLSINPCNFLKADVVEDSGLFQTKLQVVLLNCANEEIFISEVGISKEKEYKKAYQEALRDAFTSFEAINYKYEQNWVKEEPKIATKPVKEKIQTQEVIVSAVPQSPARTASVNKDLEQIKKSEKIYISEDAEFYIRSTEFGYQLFLKQIEEPFAKMVKTESEGYFIYTTMQSQGIAYFDSNGNLVVEILNPQDNSTSKKVYKVKN